MNGSLCLHQGTLWVGRHEKTAHVRAFDLDGRRLDAGFSFRDPTLGRSRAAGLALDGDRHVWVADTESGVRCFTLFGVEVGHLGVGPEPDADPELAPDVPGVVRQPVDVAVEGDSDGLRIVVASGGERRHALQVFGGSGRLVSSLRPHGDPRRRFRDLRGVALAGRTLWAAEGRGGCVQVFLDGEFHFAFATTGNDLPDFVPNAVAPLPDGRVVVACGGAGGESGGSLILAGPSGDLLRVLAGPGTGEGEVLEPTDVVLEATGRDASTRVAVIDRDGDRVQVFTLRGRCYGAFGDLAG